MTTRIKLRRDTQANWLSNNPILALGEAGHDTTNNELRIGDGSTTWSGLAAIGGASASGNLLLSADENYQLTLSNNGYLLGGNDGYQDINIGVDDGYNQSRAHLYISQDNPYIRSEVISTTNENYENDMMWHAAWFSRYSKVTTDAYGVHIKNAQWNGPANEYNNKWTFTKDGIFDLPPRAEIRANPFSQGEVGGGASYPVNDDNSDQSLTLTANTVLISGGRLDVAGSAKDGWIATLGTFPNDDGDFWYESVAVDPETNDVYAAGGGVNGRSSIVTKFYANSTVAWNKYIDLDGGAYSGQPNTITFSPMTGCVKVATNSISSPNYFAEFILDGTTGNYVDNTTYRNPQQHNITLTDMATPTWGSSDLVYVGNRDIGRAYITPDVAGVTQSIPTRLLVNANTFVETDLVPAVSAGTWTMFSADLTGNVAINNINNFTSRTATRVSGDGTGTDASFTVAYTPGGSYQVTATAGGSNYNDNDVLTISGTLLGGTSPANDVTFQITTDAGAIVSTNTITGTATALWALGLSADPVDFTAIEPPTITTATQQDGFLVWGGSQYILGNVGYDKINTVTGEYDTTDGNLYIGGQTQLQGGGGYYKAYVAKVNMDGGQVEWARCVDDYTAVNGTQQGGEVTSLVSDSSRAVISVAYNNNSNMVITKVDTNGEMVWQRTLYPYASFNGSGGIALGDNDSVVVTSGLAAYQQQYNWDQLISKIDQDGNLLWTRAFGTMQNEGSIWQYNFRDIKVMGNYYYLNGYTNGLANQRKNNANGFVAKFPLDGTGVGRYDDFYYQTLDGGIDFATVANTAANAITISWRGISGTGEEFTTGGEPDISTINETTDMLSIKTGGPGIVQGVNEVKFSNGSTITSDSFALIENAAYVGMRTGNVMASSGTYSWALSNTDLETYYYSSSFNKPQFNIDIIAEGGDADNISNWHFDENGSMYLPAQAGYRLDASPANFIDGQANGTAIFTFDLATYPKLATLVQVGDFVVDPVNENHKGTVIHTQANADPSIWDITVSQVFSDALSVPGVVLTNEQTNGIVFSDGSKQQTAGRKIIQGWPGQRNIARSFGASYNLVEQLIWTASSPDVSAFRGTVRCQYQDTSTAMKIYDVVGASAKNGDLWNAGTWDMTANVLIEIESATATTFRLDINQADLTMRIYATAPANTTVYMTTDITEFKYTYD